MKHRQLWLELVVFAVLVATGVEVRVWCWDVPNFAPVAAIALFAGYFFRSIVLATAVPLAIMFLSDWRMEAMYDTRIMAVVYGMLTLPVAFRSVARGRFGLGSGEAAANAWSTAGLLGCGLASSLAFFITTNFATWAWTTIYEPTWSGLLDCYIAALPFFRYTVAGDLFFAAVSFGTYAAMLSFRPAVVTARQGSA